MARVCVGCGTVENITIEVNDRSLCAACERGIVEAKPGDATYARAIANVRMLTQETTERLNAECAGTSAQ